MQLFKGKGEEKVKYLFRKGGKRVKIPLPNMARELGPLLLRKAIESNLKIAKIL